MIAIVASNCGLRRRVFTTFSNLLVSHALRVVKRVNAEILRGAFFCQATLKLSNLQERRGWSLSAYFTATIRRPRGGGRRRLVKLQYSLRAKVPQKTSFLQTLKKISKGVHDDDAHLPSYELPFAITESKRDPRVTRRRVNLVQCTSTSRNWSTLLLPRPRPGQTNRLHFPANYPCIPINYAGST